MTLFAVAHYENAQRPSKQLRPTFHTNSIQEAKTKFEEWCTNGGPNGSGVFFFDYHFFGGYCHTHVF